MSPKRSDSTDRLVVLVVLVLLVAGDLLSHGELGTWAFAQLSRFDAAQYFPVAIIGMLVGFAELVSRYRDEPWLVARRRPGLIFIALNGLAACFALFMLRAFPEQLHSPANGIILVLEAGTGAMVTIRSKIFTVHQPGGSDVAVGPAFILDTVLAAINRDVDRRRASERSERVATMATKLNQYDYKAASAFLIASLGAFQNMDEEVAKRLRSQLQQLLTDDTLKGLPNQVKYVIAGYSILTEYGDRTFDEVFLSLSSYLKGTV